MMTPVFLTLLFLSVNAAPSRKVFNQIIEEVPHDVSQTIEKANEASLKNLVHGDLMLKRQRNADPCATSEECLWPRKNNSYVYVPIRLSDAYSREEKNIIINGLLPFHRTTCIRFVWYTGQSNYLDIKSDSGCYSYLGRQKGPQTVSLSKRGCLYKDTVQHEALHALGFHHEQVRSDRDQYVTIKYQNIRRGMESNFQKEDTNNMKTAYDFNSVMQYGNYAFSKNDKPTIVSKINPKQIFGRASEMSQNDIDRVNELYCKEKK